jgi:hypothetical protein
MSCAPLLSSFDLLRARASRPVAPFNSAAVFADAPLSFDRPQPCVTQPRLAVDRNRIPSKPAMPFQCRYWTLYARMALDKRLHVYAPPRKLELSYE